MANYNSVEVTQGNGDLIQSGIVFVSTANGGWVTVTFPIPFSSTPIVTSGSYYTAGYQFYTTMRNVTNTGFQIIAMNYDGTAHSNPTCSMSWIAIGGK